jgi:outer membrane protein OmpA-like peptidoglycan-associated protein
LACFTSAAFAADDVILLRGTPSSRQILEALAAPQSPEAETGMSGASEDSVLRQYGLTLSKPAAPAQARQQPPQQTQQPRQTQPPRQAQRTPRSGERKLDLQVLFEFDSDRLTREGMVALDSLGEAFASEQLSDVRRITLEGHTDAVGNAGYNADLSRRRAESARAYLTSRFGTGGRAIRAVGKGASEPVANADPRDAINRRVRIIVGG